MLLISDVAVQKFDLIKVLPLQSLSLKTKITQKNSTRYFTAPNQHKCFKHALTFQNWSELCPCNCSHCARGSYSIDSFCQLIVSYQASWKLFSNHNFTSFTTSASNRDRSSTNAPENNFTHLVTKTQQYYEIMQINLN